MTVWTAKATEDNEARKVAAADPTKGGSTAVTKSLPKVRAGTPASLAPPAENAVFRTTVD